jgi:hypothetical protein
MHNLAGGRRATTVPGKLYEYMASERPILAAVPEGDAKDFLRQCGTASVCRPDDIEGMIGILDKIYESWKNGEQVARSNRSFVSQFERRALTHVLAQALNARFAVSGDPTVHDSHQSSETVCPV